MKRAWCVRLMVLAGALSSAAASAQEPAEQAHTLFVEGREAMKRGDYVSACQKFEQSQRLDASLGTVLNQGVCEDHQGHLVRARALLEHFFASADPQDDRLPSARAFASQLEARLPRVTIEVEPALASGVVLAIDGKAQPFESGAAFPVDPGEHQLELRAPHSEPSNITVGLVEAQRWQWRPALTVVPPSPAPTRHAPAPAAVTHAPARAALSPLFYVALGTAVAGAVTVFGSAAMISAERAQVQEHCSDKVCDNLGVAAGRRGKTLVVLNTIAWPVTLASASVAACFVLFRGSQPQQQYALRATATSGLAALVLEGHL